MKITITQPPALKHDAMMLKEFGSTVGARGKLERRIAWNLINHLLASGFKLHSMNDGDDITVLTDPQQAMELIFNLDEASLRFYAANTERTDDDWHGVMLILGEGLDIINDWNYTKGDADGFDAAMEAFDVDACA